MYNTFMSLQRGFELAIDTLKRANKFKKEKEMYLDEHIEDIVVNQPEVVREDSIVNEVIESFKERSRIGILKYNTTLDRTDIDFIGWVNHLQQELMDATLYLERLKKEYNGK